MNSRSNRQARQTDASPLQISPWGYVAISAIGLIVGISLLLVFIWTAPELKRNNISQNVFYVLLIPLGLSTAAFLFGAMNSWASFRGTHWSGKLVLGGPIVGTALTILGGIVLIPANIAIQVVVRPQLIDSAETRLTEGVVWIDFGIDRRSAPLNRNGEAQFLQVPDEYRARKVKVEIEASGYMQDDRTVEYDLSSGVVYVKVKRTPGRSFYPQGLEKVYASSADIQSELNQQLTNVQGSALFVGINFHISAADRFNLLKKKVREGVNLTYVIVNPYSRFIDLIASNEDVPTAKLQQECIEGLTTLLLLRKESLQEKSRGSVDILFLEWPPNYRAYILDQRRRDARSFLISYLQGIKSPYSPALLITNDEQSALFATFSSSAEHLLKSAISLREFFETHGTRTELRAYNVHE